MNQSLFDAFFQLAPDSIDVAAIRREYAALQLPYRVDARGLPLPVWARRPLSDTGPQAWSTLCRELGGAPSDRTYCVYVHVPFCASKCAFCDCYSFRLSRHVDEHVATYLDALEGELRAWGGLSGLAARPVSTVHFGGGTPTLLDTTSFERLVDACHAHLRTGPDTEWALESTTSELTGEMLALLEARGFTRLHIGVQSLAPQVRRTLARREPPEAVLVKIAGAVQRGWIVSVDLIIGLPGATLAGLLADIETLAGAGVDGFSLYELQLSSRNRRFAEQHWLVDRDRTSNYFLLQAAAQRLSSLGYRKTLFNHWARARDTNLYFTFPERGEDCLALGTIADGVFGDYHYRHPEYPAYRRGARAGFPELQGGLRRTALENRVQPLEVALLSARLAPELFARQLGTATAAQLLDGWRASALVEDDPACPGGLRLTANGSWLAGAMLADLTGAFTGT